MELDAKDLLKNDFGARIRHGWLKMNFGAVTYHAGRTGIVARLSHAYRAVSDPRDMLFGLLTRTEIPTYLVPEQASGPTASAALSRLYSRLAWDGTMLYLPKPGQTEHEAIVPEQPYFFIHRHDPEHSHAGAPELVDFGHVDMHGGWFLRKHGLRSKHYHLLAA